MKIVGGLEVKTLPVKKFTEENSSLDSLYWKLVNWQFVAQNLQEHQRRAT